MMDDAELLRRFTRGQVPAHELAVAGVDVDLHEDHAVVQTSNACMIVPGITDVATGFLTHRYDDHALREWAIVLLAASSCIDLATLESGSTGEILLQALWDITAGKGLSERDWNVIDSIA